MYMKRVLFVSVLAVVLGATYGVHSQAQPKRLLLVTTSLGFRHAGVTVQERMIRDMARTSGDFTVVSTTDSPNYPTAEYAAAIERLSSRIPRGSTHPRRRHRLRSHPPVCEPRRVHRSCAGSLTTAPAALWNGLRR